MIRRKPRVVKVCTFCKKRKIKCDKGSPCSSCVKYNNAVCEYVHYSGATAEDLQSINLNRLNSLVKKMDRLSNKFSPEDFGSMLESMENVVRLGQISLKQNIPFETLRDGEDDSGGSSSSNDRKKGGSGVTTTAVGHGSSKEGSSSSTTQLNDMPSLVGDILNDEPELSDLVGTEIVQDFEMALQPKFSSPFGHKVPFDHKVPLDSVSPGSDAFGSMFFKGSFDFMSEMYPYNMAPCPGTPTSDDVDALMTSSLNSDKILINFRENTKHSDFPFAVLGLLSTDAVLWDFYKNNYINNHNVKQEFMADLDVVSPRSTAYMEFPSYSSSKYSSTSFPGEFLLNFQEEESIANSAVSLNTNMSIIDLLSKIVEVLPPYNVIQDMVDRFFAKAYVFLPVLDQYDTNAKIFELLSADFLSQRITHIGVKSLDDLAHLGVILLVIRFGYVVSIDLQHYEPEYDSAQISSQLFTLAEIIAIKLNTRNIQNLPVLQLLFLVKSYRLFGPEFGYGNHGLAGEKIHLNLIDLCKNLGYDTPASESLNEEEYKNHNLGIKVLTHLVLFGVMSLSNLGDFRSELKVTNFPRPPVCSNNKDQNIEKVSSVIIKWVPFFYKRITKVRHVLSPGTLCSLDDLQHLVRLSEAHITDHANNLFEVFNDLSGKPVMDIIKGGNPISVEDRENGLLLKTVGIVRLRNICSLHSSKVSLSFHLYVNLFNSNNIKLANEYFVLMLEAMYDKCLIIIDSFFHDPDFAGSGWYVFPYLHLLMQKIMIIDLGILLRTKGALQLVTDGEARVHLSLFANLINITIRIYLRLMGKCGLDTLYYSCWKYGRIVTKFLSLIETMDFGLVLNSLDSEGIRSLMTQFNDNKLMDKLCSSMIKNIKSVHLQDIMLPDGIKSYNEIYQFLRGDR